MSMHFAFVLLQEVKLLQSQKTIILGNEYPFNRTEESPNTGYLQGEHQLEGDILFIVYFLVHLELCSTMGIDQSLCTVNLWIVYLNYRKRTWNNIILQIKIYLVIKCLIASENLYSVFINSYILNKMLSFQLAVLNTRRKTKSPFSNYKQCLTEPLEK